MGKNRLRARRPFLVLLLLAACAPGCQTFHTYRPVAIEVRDAETKKPIAGVDVRISYPMENGPTAPADSKDATGADGVVRLRATPFGRAGIKAEISAAGHISELKYLSLEEVQAIEPAHWFEDVNKRPVNLVMEMFAGPEPTLELVARIGFRGTFKVKLEVQPDLPMPVGQRAFRLEVPSSNEGVLAGPALLRHVSPANMTVKFADDAPLSHWAKGTELGYWWLKVDAGYHYFLIGTQADYDDYRRTLEATERQNRTSGNGQSKGSGGGRHGHKGGM